MLLGGVHVNARDGAARVGLERPAAAPLPSRGSPAPPAIQGRGTCCSETRVDSTLRAAQAQGRRRGGYARAQASCARQLRRMGSRGVSARPHQPPICPTRFCYRAARQAPTRPCIRRCPPLKTRPRPPPHTLREAPAPDPPALQPLLPRKRCAAAIAVSVACMLHLNLYTISKALAAARDLEAQAARATGTHGSRAGGRSRGSRTPLCYCVRASLRVCLENCVYRTSVRVLMMRAKRGAGTASLAGTARTARDKAHRLPAGARGETQIANAGGPGGALCAEHGRRGSEGDGGLAAGAAAALAAAGALPLAPSWRRVARRDVGVCCAGRGARRTRKASVGA
jgi:hypothetical protein